MKNRQRRPLGHAVKAPFRYLDEHSPAEVFGGVFRRIRRRISAISAAIGRRLADPFVLSMLVGGALVLGGLAGIGLAWRGTADKAFVALQFAYLVSGGLAGVAVVLVGLGVLHIQGSRRNAAREQAQMERVREKSLLLLDTVSMLRRSRTW